VTPSRQTDDNCRVLDLEPGTYHIAGHEFVVAQRWRRRSYRVDGVRVDPSVFVALLETALLLERLPADNDD